MCLQYMANGDSEALEAELDTEETRERVKPMAAELALMMARKAMERRTIWYCRVGRIGVIFMFIGSQRLSPSAGISKRG